jgi:hypothetical protein
VALDPGGVPLRVRSHLARLRPEYKDAAVAVRDRVRPGVTDRFEVAVRGWLDGLGTDLGASVLLAGVDAVPDSWPARVVRLDPHGRGDAIAFIGPFDGDLIGRGSFDTIVVVLGADAADLVGHPSQPAGRDIGRAIEDALDAAVEAVRPGGLVAVAARREFAGALHRPNATVQPLVDDQGPLGDVAVITVGSIVSSA